MSLPKHWLHDCANTHTAKASGAKKNSATFSHTCSICDLDHHVYTPGIQLAVSILPQESVSFSYSDTYRAELRTFTLQKAGRGPPAA